MVQLVALLYKDQPVIQLHKLLNIWLESSLSESSDDNESNTSRSDRGELIFFKSNGIFRLISDKLMNAVIQFLRPLVFITASCSDRDQWLDVNSEARNQFSYHKNR